MEEHYDVDKAYAAQKKYCWDNNLHNFAPMDGCCYACNRQIFKEDGYSVEYAAEHHITGCPLCHTSYVD